MAGLPPRSAWVWVGPPLKASAPRLGSMPVMLPSWPLTKPPADALPMRLLDEPGAQVPETSDGDEPAVFPATIELRSEAPPARILTPPTLFEVLAAMVELCTEKVPMLAIPPPLQVPWLPEIVEFTTASVPAFQMPPPEPIVELPEMVDDVMVTTPLVMDMPPPPPSSAWLAVMATPVRLTTLALDWIPAPSCEPVRRPPVTVSPLMLMVKSAPGDPPSRNTRNALLPLIESRFAPGPEIVTL
ncbi:MAG: hypothetical protein GIKADHBN_02973 [Phycisphaerales bacterium]|nr:hypothetical protein [Phycisphaerales bacterium]